MGGKPRRTRPQVGRTEAQERKWEEQNRRWEENRAELDRKWEEQNRRWEEHQAELNRKWEAQERKWEEQNRRWEEHQAELNRKWEEQNRRWEENRAELDRKWEEQNRRWEENRAELDRKWEEQNQKWEKNHAEIRQMLEAISNLSRKYNGAIGALGARWGLYSEAAFRNGLKGILEESFDVQVLNVVEYDEQGEVFGRPDQIELDIIVKDGQLIICEIKSSMSKSDMYIFERKVRFYEKLHNRAADRMMVISPMVDKRAQVVADDLGIQVYSYADTVDRAIFEPA